RGLASLLEASLLALDDAGVARKEPGLLEGGAVVLAVDLVEGTGDREAQRARLTRGAAARDLGLDVVGAEQVEHLERVVDELLVQLVREVVLEGAAVHREGAGARNEAHLRDGLLATADRGARHVEHGTRGAGGLIGRGLGRERGESLGRHGVFDLRHGCVPWKSLGAYCATWVR